MAYASTVRLFESGHSRQEGDVFYILPHPDNDKPSISIDAVLTRRVKDQWRTGPAMDETKQSRIGHFMTHLDWRTETQRTI